MACDLAAGPRRTTLTRQAKTAGARWHVEGGFESAKQDVGLADFEVRSWTGWHRHITLFLLAHAVLAAVRDLVDGPPKKSAGQPELIALTVPETRRLLIQLLWSRPPDVDEVLSWSEWRRGHQAFARRCHFKKRGAELPD